ncbi:MAG: peptidoglycan-associated lipoprotein Pal [Burkholderiales bacterium]|nr:peptidoglycan-associated lipoprotein Pal [Burkholderiales bacterium]
MKLTLARNLIGLSAVAMLAACATKEQPAAPVTNNAPAQPPVTTKAPEPVKAAIDPLNDPNSALAKRSVYFDFDKYDIRDDQRATVDAHGKYLAGRGDRSVRIEGNADERGSREYNLALGQKRAEAVKKALEVLGAKEGQLEATSNGKEKPKATGHDEASWAENRRDDIVYKGL